jgi:mRNA-degrading endonuclease RelE of RelBE toxin-antitoxin system
VTYAVYLHGQVSEQIRRLQPRSRRLILAAIHTLAERPHAPADFEEVEANGRPLGVKLAGKYAIAYHIDDPCEGTQDNRLAPSGRLNKAEME